MRILITGSTGLVGSAVARQFVRAGHEVAALHRSGSNRSLLRDIAPGVEWVEGDILDVLSLEKATAGADAVVHAAAVVSFIPRDADLLFKVNVEGTANVVNACLKSGVRRLCHVSSVAALGRPDPRRLEAKVPLTIDETQRWTESSANSTYAKTKYLAELEAWRGIAEGLPTVIVNPSVVLGEGDWSKSSTQLFKYVYDGNPFYTQGTVNYVDVRDVARAIEALVLADVQGERFILNAGSCTYRELFATIAAGFGKPAPRFAVGPALAGVLGRLEAARSWLTGSRPLVTPETARSASQRYHYGSEKVRRVLSFDFQPLDQTVRRVCESFLEGR